MKRIAIGIISLYQMVISPLLRSLLGVQNACRYTISCSEYAKRSVHNHGVLRGSILATKRLLSCQPFGRIQE